MGIFGKISFFLDSDEVKSKKSHLKNMFTVAIACGGIKSNKVDFVINKAQALYLTQDQITSVLYKSEDVSFIVPKTINERVDQLHDLIDVAVVCDLNIKAITLCKSFATLFGFNPQIIDKIIAKMIVDLNVELTEKMIYDILKGI